MSAIPEINSDFIREWEPRFESTGHSYVRYPEIIEAVRKEIPEHGTISEDTFKDIVEWKAKRAEGKVDWARFDAVYNPRFRCADALSLHSSPVGWARPTFWSAQHGERFLIRMIKYKCRTSHVPPQRAKPSTRAGHRC